MTFKEKLVILRKSRGLTQDDFASAVGVSRQAVYKWESGQSYPEVPKLLEMKQLFSISIDELLDDNYDIPLPEKKKRKRTPKPAPAPKAASVAQPAPAPAPKAVPVAQPTPAPAPKVAPVAQPTPAPAPKVEPVAQPTPAPAPKAAPVAQPTPAPAPKVEPVAQPTPAPAPKVEPVAKPEPKIDTVPAPTEIELNDLKEADESTKKTSFFDRLFGRK